MIFCVHEESETPMSDLSCAQRGRDKRDARNHGERDKTPDYTREETDHERMPSAQERKK